MGDWLEKKEKSVFEIKGEIALTNKTMPVTIAACAQATFAT